MQVSIKAGPRHSFGVDVADIGVTRHVRGQAVTVYAQPRSLLRFLAAARIWVAIQAPATHAVTSAATSAAMSSGVQPR